MERDPPSAPKPRRERPPPMQGETGREWYHGLTSPFGIEGARLQEWEKHIKSDDANRVFKMIRPQLSRMSGKEVTQAPSNLVAHDAGLW